MGDHLIMTVDSQEGLQTRVGNYKATTAQEPDIIFQYSSHPNLTLNLHPPTFPLTPPPPPLRSE